MDDSNYYSRRMIALHWVIAVLVLAAVLLALYRASLPTGDLLKPAVMSLHMSVGMAIWALAIFRVFVRSNATLPTRDGSSHIAALLETAVHRLMYAALLVLPLMGLGSVWLRGRPFTFFGMFSIPSPLAADWTSATGKLLEKVHTYAAFAFVAVIALHIAAALYHRFIRRDDVLARMLPRPRQS